MARNLASRPPAAQPSGGFRHLKGAAPPQYQAPGVAASSMIPGAFLLASTLTQRLLALVGHTAVEFTPRLLDQRVERVELRRHRRREVLRALSVSTTVSSSRMWIFRSGNCEDRLDVEHHARHGNG